MIYNPLKKGFHREEDSPDTACKGDHWLCQKRGAGAAIDGVSPQRHKRQGITTRERGDSAPGKTVKLLRIALNRQQ
jgi:hypothetical protein